MNPGIRLPSLLFRRTTMHKPGLGSVTFYRWVWRPNKIMRALYEPDDRDGCHEVPSGCVDDVLGASSFEEAMAVIRRGPQL